MEVLGENGQKSRMQTAGMFQRLVKHNYWKKANCILISMGGVPTRACRRFIRRLSDERKLPVYVFTDGDPYGFLNIHQIYICFLTG